MSTNNNNFSSINDTRYSIFAWNILSTPKNLPNQEGAKKLLGRCIPILNKLCVLNKTAVVNIAEFFPRNANLLGLNYNGGEKIEVRLRQANDKSKLLCFEEVLCTLCHELTHNFVGPHNEEFWRTYRKIVAQAEEVIANGLVGNSSGSSADSSSSSGHRLGSTNENNNNNRNSSSSSATSSFFQGTGNRLGGATVFAARQAARESGSNRNNNNKNSAGEKMRELVLGAVLKRFFERDHQKCLQSQHANDRNDGSVTENYPQCCGGNAGNMKQEAKQGFLSQISPSCGTRQSAEASTMIRLSQQQKEQEKEKSKDDEQKNKNSNSSFKPKTSNQNSIAIILDDEPWTCDLCGRTAKGTYCSWCCGEDYESSNKNGNSNSQVKTKKDTSSTTSMMMMMPSGNYQRDRMTNNDDDNDDPDCSFDAVIDHSDDVIMSNSPIRLSNSPLNEANRNHDGSKHENKEINSKAIVAAQQERRRRTRETAEVIELHRLKAKIKICFF